MSNKCSWWSTERSSTHNALAKTAMSNTCWRYKTTTKLLQRLQCLKIATSRDDMHMRWQAAVASCGASCWERDASTNDRCSDGCCCCVMPRCQTRCRWGSACRMANLDAYVMTRCQTRARGKMQQSCCGWNCGCQPEVAAGDAATCQTRAAREVASWANGCGGQWLLGNVLHVRWQVAAVAAAAVCATFRTKFNMVTSANVSDDGGIRHDALPMHTAVYTCMLATTTGEINKA